MTVGIYSIYFEEPDLYYIGQSQNIELRFRKHLNLLKLSKHSNYKLQEAYNLYGMPSHMILETCTIKDLNSKEIYWQNEFNSLNSLDIITAGVSGGYGINNSASKYSLVEILKVFRYLYLTNFKNTDIAKIVSVNPSLVNNIVQGKAHTWLKERYPKLYSRMLLRDNFIITNKINQYIIKDIKEFVVLNAYLFPNTSIDNIRKGISKLKTGKVSSYKNYTLASNNALGYLGMSE